MIKNTFLVKKVNLTPKESSFIEFVLGMEFPWFYQMALNDIAHFGHCLMFRDDQKLPISGRINSEHYVIVEEIFKKFCEENNIKVNNILRAGINTTVHSTTEGIGIHTDHAFPHYNWLMYLNTVSGDTIIYQENGEKRVSPEAGTAILFSGDKHTHEFCGPDQRRVVIVVTFN